MNPVSENPKEETKEFTSGNPEQEPERCWIRVEISIGSEPGNNDAFAHLEFIDGEVLVTELDEIDKDFPGGDTGSPPFQILAHRFHVIETVASNLLAHGKAIEAALEGSDTAPK